MADTQITLAPSVANASGAATITASAALFTASDVGRLVGIQHKCSTQRAAATAYAVGTVFYAEYNTVPRLYRVVGAGTTAAASLAGTTPDYDLNCPNETGLHILDGTCVLRYLGPGRHVWGWCTITGFTSSTVVAVNIDPRGTFGSTYGSLRWRLGEFSDARGWPIAGTFHRGRLWLFGTDTRPQTLWASEAGDFESFAPTELDGAVLDTNGITVTLDDDQVNRARWLVSTPRGLLAGTASGEFMVAAAQRDAAPSPSNITAQRQGDRGSDVTTEPQRIGGIVLFPQRGGRRLRELQYSFESDRFQSPDLAALADQVAADGFTATAYADVPDGAWYGVRSDGQLAVLTYDPEQKLRAWTLDAMGGGGIIESATVVPDPAGTGSDLYLSVLRTLNGVETRTIEVVRSPFRADLESQAAAFFVDCGLTYSGTPVNTVTGLSHLEGWTVSILADGSVRQAQTVASGQVEVTGPASSQIHVGLPFTSRIVDLPPEITGQQGTVQGVPKRVHRATIRLDASGAAQIGGRNASSEVLTFRDTDDAMDTAVPLFTGDRQVATYGHWGDDGQLVIETAEPLPLTVLAIVKELQIG